MDPLIRVRNLRFRYDDGTQALDGLDFDLYPGETVALFGPNGSGKTTLLLCLVGLLDGEGEIEVCGQRLRRETRALIRQKTGVLFQDSDDQLFMPTVFDDVAFGPRNLGLDPARVERKVRHCLRVVGLEGAAAKAPYHLSAGEKRRAALAGVLALDPEVLALDEPATFLDPPGRAALIETLRALPQAKLIVTHDVDLARELGTRAVFLSAGRIIDSGPVEKIARRYQWETARIDDCVAGD